MKNIIITIIQVLIMFGVYHVATVGMDKQAVNQCNNQVVMLDTVGDYYMTSNEVATCTYYQVELPQLVECLGYYYKKADNFYCE